MMLSGKKTYLVALGGVLTAVGGLLTGTMDVGTAIQLIFTSLSAATIRKGITTESGK